MTFSTQYSASSQREPKPISGNKRSKLRHISVRRKSKQKLNGERSEPTSARRTPERRPFNVNKRRKLRLISGKKKPELW